VKQAVNALLKQSVAYAFEHPKSSLEFIRAHAQEMEEEVMYKHIELYVNAYSKDLGELGRKAIQTMFDRAIQRGLIPSSKQKIFLTENS